MGFVAGHGAERERTGVLVRDAAFTVLFAVVAAVAAVSLENTLTKPFQTGSLGLAQWALFGVTVVGATLAFVRTVGSYASHSLLARLRRRGGDESAARPPNPAPHAQSADAAPAQRRLHPVVDDVSWAALTVAVAGFDTLALWAILLTLGQLFGDRQIPAAWLLWQLAVLTAALAGLIELTRAIAAELRDRSLRRRRDAVHVITDRLIYWPRKPQRSSSAARRGGRAGAVAAAAVLAAASWASASGPLLEPVAAPATAAAGSRSDPGADSSAKPASAAPAARPPARSAGSTARRHAGSTARRRAGSSAPRRAGSPRSRRERKRSESRARRDDTPPVTVSTPPPPPVSTAPPPTAAPPATTAPATTQPRENARERDPQKSGRRARKRRRHKENRPRPTPTPTPTAVPPAATLSPTPVPPAATPSPTPGPPCGQPPCGPGVGTPPPP